MLIENSGNLLLKNFIITGKIYRLFAPSTIASFGPSTPKINTPNVTIQRPETMYGITKVNHNSLNLLSNYYSTGLYGVIG